MDILGPMDNEVKPRPETAKTYIDNILYGEWYIEHILGGSPRTQPWFIDIDAGSSHFSVHRGKCPTITKSRPNGFYVTSHQRRLKKSEMFKLNGMDSSSFQVAVPPVELGKQCGNSMSINVLCRVLCRALPCAGLAEEADLVDKWQSGEAFKELCSPRQKPFKNWPCPLVTKCRRTR